MWQASLWQVMNMFHIPDVIVTVQWPLVMICTCKESQEEHALRECLSQGRRTKVESGLDWEAPWTLDWEAPSTYYQRTSTSSEADVFIVFCDVLFSYFVKCVLICRVVTFLFIYAWLYFITELFYVLHTHMYQQICAHKRILLAHTLPSITTSVGELWWKRQRQPLHWMCNVIYK